jgi:adenylate cyclase
MVEQVERRLAAVLAADVAGYSRLMGADEEGTLARLKAIRKSLVDPAIAAHRGRVVKTTGDGMLVVFASAVDAARSAIEVQRSMSSENAGVQQDSRIEFRIGIHIGDIMIDDSDIFGDGVNIAARLEALAEPGGICVSRMVRDQVRDKLAISFEDMGEQQVKNIARPVRAYRAVLAETPARPSILSEAAALRALPDRPSIAVLPFHNVSGDPEQEYFVDGITEDIITACRNGAGFSSSPAIPHSPTKENRSTSRRLAATLASAMSLRGACAEPGSGCASAANSSI